MATVVDQLENVYLLIGTISWAVLEKSTYGGGTRERFACCMAAVCLRPGRGESKERGDNGVMCEGSHFVSETLLDC